MGGIPATTSGTITDVDGGSNEATGETPAQAIISEARNDEDGKGLTPEQETQLEHANELREMGYDELADAVEFKVATDLVAAGYGATLQGPNGENITASEMFTDEAAQKKFDEAFLSLQGKLKGGESVAELKKLNIAAAHLMAGFNPGAEAELNAAIEKLNNAQTENGQAIALLELSATVYVSTALTMGHDADAVGFALSLLTDTATHDSFLLMAGGAVNMASLNVVIDMLNDPNKTPIELATMNQAKAGLDSVGTKISEQVTMLMKLINEA